MQKRFHSPVLMYHAIGLPVVTRRDEQINVSAADFQRQMRVLLTLGYTVRPFYEIVDSLVSARSLSRRTLAITFDDAYLSVGTVAAPIMKSLGIVGTTFVVSSWSGAGEVIGLENGRLNSPVLDWDGLRALVDQSWEVGGHTMSHVHLDSLEDSAAMDEISKGKLDVEQAVGTELATFCYPFGHINVRTSELVRAAGFRGACTVRSGIAARRSDPYLIPRVKIAYRDGVVGLLYRLLVRPSLPTFRTRRRSHTMSRDSTSL